MGKPKDPFDLQKVTINLRRGDPEWIKIYHGRTGLSKFLREMLAAHIDHVEAKYAKMKDEE